MKKLITFVFALMCVFSANASDYYLENLNTTDVYIRSSLPNNSFDTGDLIMGGWGDTYISMVKFNITSLPAVNSGGKVSVWFYNRSPGGAAQPTQVQIGLLASNFNSSTTWNSSGLSWYTSTVRSVNVSAYGYWTEFDITDYYNYWKGGVANYGFAIVPVNTNNYFNIFPSSSTATVVAQKPIVRITDDPYRFLSFPLNTSTFNNWKTAPLTSIMDHAKSGAMTTTSGNVDSNTVVTAFNGELGSNYPGNYLTVWCPYRATSNGYLSHPVGGNIPYTGDSNSGCLGQSTLSYNGHNGFDYGVPNQTPVYASSSGVVTENQCTGSGGSCSAMGRVILKHVITVNGVQKIFYTWYMHLSKAILSNGSSYSIGQTINEGQQLGLSGATGAGSAYHLHFEVRIGGTGVSGSYGAPVDPFGWYGSGSDPLNTTIDYQVPYSNDSHTNRLLWK